MNITIKIPFKPVACARPRVTRFGTYYPPAYKAFKKDVCEWLRENCNFQIISKTPLHVDYEFIFARQKKHTVSKYGSGRIHKITRPDLDNYVKAVNDVIQDAGVILDDSHIVSMSASKAFGTPEEEDSINVKITMLSN